MRTYAVELYRLGRTFTIEVWAYSAADARRKAKDAYADADIGRATVRQAF